MDPTIASCASHQRVMKNPAVGPLYVGVQDTVAAALQDAQGDDAARVEAAEQHGGIPAIVGLLDLSRSDSLKHEVAAKLRRLSCKKTYKVAIAQAGGIAPLVALARDGTGRKTAGWHEGCSENRRQTAKRDKKRQAPKGR